MATADVEKKFQEALSAEAELLRGWLEGYMKTPARKNFYDTDLKGLEEIGTKIKNGDNVNSKDIEEELNTFKERLTPEEQQNLFEYRIKAALKERGINPDSQEGQSLFQEIVKSNTKEIKAGADVKKIIDEQIDKKNQEDAEAKAKAAADASLVVSGVQQPLTASPKPQPQSQQKEKQEAAELVVNKQESPKAPSSDKVTDISWRGVGDLIGGGTGLTVATPVFKAIKTAFKKVMNAATRTELTSQNTPGAGPKAQPTVTPANDAEKAELTKKLAAELQAQKRKTAEEMAAEQKLNQARESSKKLTPRQ